MRRELLACALALPLLMIVLGIVRAERHFARSRDWTFDIEGYDPRDLLRGQYIQYRIAFHEQPGSECADGSESCCLCLTEQGVGQPPGVTRRDCAEARAACDGVLDTRQLAALGRYYIPEARAAELARVLPPAGSAAAGTAQIVLAIDGEGTAQVKSLRVRGKPIVGR